MRFDAMELVGIVVSDLDQAIERFTTLFGLEFKQFRTGIDFVFSDESDAPDVSAPRLPTSVRMAMDTSGCFELIEIPGTAEGFRNIHFRVDDIESASAHLQERGLRLVQRLRAGTVREFIFDAADLNGIRLCLVQYEGPSFAEALDASDPAY